MDRSALYYCPECDREHEETSEIAASSRCPVDGSQLFKLPEGLSPGVVIDGRYTILRPLGQGGMGIIFEAEHHATRQRVAVKLISALGDDDIAVRRFFREAKASTRIVHPGVVEVYDFGQTPDGRPYMVMEIIDGEPLDELLAREGALDPHRAAHIAGEIASALGASHALQILHRDLKPSNVMIRKENGVERIKVLDFGLAKAVQDDTGELGTLTATGMLVGTPQYMSPEQFRCAQLGPATDLYSLGVILYEMLAGKLPFQGDNVFAMMQAHVMEEPLAPGEVSPQLKIPKQIEEFCLQLLRKAEQTRGSDTVATAKRLRQLAGEDFTGPSAKLLHDQNLPPDSLELVQDTLSTPVGGLSVVESMEVERFRPALVGRDQTRKFLENILQRSLQSARPAVVALEGPGGMGKSKILDWYRTRADRSGCRVVQGLYSEGHLGPQGALKGVLEELLGAAGESWDTIDARLDQMIDARDETDSEAPTPAERDRLRGFLRPSVTESAARSGFAVEDREVLYETLLRVMRWAAADEPTLVIMDDLREDRPFDPAFVDRLGTQLATTEQPLVIIMAVRTGDPADISELAATAASSLAGVLREQFYRIELSGLDDEEITTLIRRAMPGISDDASTRIAELAGGNPLFTLQLLRNMVAEGSLRREGRGWELCGEPTLPEDLHGVIDARLARLRGRDDEEALIVRAALIGPRVPIELLEEALEREGNFDLLDEIDDLLDRLVDDGWLRDAESWDEEAVVFEHGFVHEALRDRYGSKRAARKIHAHIAEALEVYYTDELEPVASRIADHFLASRNHARGLPFLIQAARAAEGRYAIEDAIDVWRRGVDSLARARADEETSARVRRGLARTLIYAAEYAEAARVLDQLGDDASSMELRGDLADAQADHDRALICYEAAIGAAEEMIELADLSRLKCKSSLIHEKRSEYSPAAEAAEEALDLAKELASSKLRGNALNRLAMIAQLSGDLERSMEYLNEEEAVWRKLGDDVALGRCLYTRGGLYWRLSEFDKALAAFGTAVPLLERSGHRKGLGHCLRVAGSMAQRIGRLDEALDYCHRAHEIFSQIDDRRGLQRVSGCYADVYSARKEHEEAMFWAQKALKMAEEMADVHAQSDSLITLGETNLESGAIAPAIEFFNRALTLEDGSGAENWERAYTHEKLGEALNFSENCDRSVEHFQKAIAIYEKIGNSQAAHAIKVKLEDN